MAELNLVEILEGKLLSVPEYVSENGKVLKAKVYEDTMATKPELIRLLLSSEPLKKQFFEEVDGITVFDKQKFAWLLENREFLPDSYTRYKNKIGLSDKNGNLISSSEDVVLSFPYKDCVLVGGQENDDENRDEIFFNELIGSQQITRMLEPKVLSNAKRYTVDGIENGIEFQDDDNLIIKGNNLIALSSLLERYEGKVKCIYIDPPYNTGSDSFGYNDDFNHSTWLTFMKNRLTIAKRLLSDDGVIFIQIDCSRQNAGSNKGSSEVGYLMVLADEIFERKNYIGQLHWKKKKQPSYLSKIAGVMETILIYAKNETKVEKLALESGSDATKKIDNATNKESERIIKKGILCKCIKNGVIPAGIYKNKTMQTEYLDNIIVENNIVQNDFKAKARFLNTQDEINRFCDEKLIFITQNKSFRRYKDENEKTKLKSITDLLLDWGQNQDANEEIKQIFEINDTKKIFDTPKPELLLKNLIMSCTREDDLIMDFFLGSGTTAAVAHKIGRKYIGIEQMDYIKDVTVERMKKVIEGEQGGISKEVDWNGGGSFVYCELMENANALISIIESATKDNIDDIKAEIYADERILPYITSEELKGLEEFEKMDLNEKKKTLISLVDKNKLYVNYSDIDDTDYEVSEEDKAFTRSFYEEV